MLPQVRTVDDVLLLCDCSGAAAILSGVKASGVFVVTLHLGTALISSGCLFVPPIRLLLLFNDDCESFFKTYYLFPLTRILK